MRRYFGWALASAVSVTLGGLGGAAAADMAVKARPMVAPVMTYNWTGCYIGGNVGGGWHKQDANFSRNVAGTVFTPPVDLGSSEGSAFIGGAQVGCDYQFGGNWVVGAQGMFDFGNIDSSNTFTDARVLGFSQQTRTRDIFTGTARLGYLFVPQLLGYVKGGGAWTRSNTSVFQPGGILLSETGSADRSGWTVGGGLEWMFAPSWSVFAEYNYMDFGRKDISFVAAPNTVGVATVNSTRLTMQTALVGVNYKFNWGWGAPVTARY
jgi:outer membrane immunogenic protein